MQSYLKGRLICPSNRTPGKKKFPPAQLPCILLSLCLVAVLPLRATAWGGAGHRIVARLAWQRLSPKAKQEVRKLLKPGETLESVASWADQARDSRPETKRWHFVDIPVTQTNYDPARDCKRTIFGDCIINALGEFQDLLGHPAKLEEYALVLANPKEKKQARYEALKFLVHLAGDLHQPLHCADNHDRGGNDVKVTFFGAPSNLHKVWDSDIIARSGLNQTASRVTAAMAMQDLAAISSKPIVDWALESHQAAIDHAYKLPANKALNNNYYQSNRPVVDGQLLKAGVRLANILNEVFQ